jgi:glycosyltransferase involved in cell wall biosynthesis
VREFGARTKVERTARYLRALAWALRGPRPLAVVVQSIPVYAVLAAPFARSLRVPVLLWFTQARGGRLLHVAARTADAILTVDRRSVPLASRKIRPIGHGIDVAAIPCSPSPSNSLLQGRGLRLLGLGRYNPSKAWDVAVRALAEVPAAELTIHGSVEKPGDEVYRSGLDRLAASLGVAERVHLEGPVPRSRVPQLLARCDALVNPTGGTTADKVVFEAAAACRPVFARSPVFESLLPPELRFDDATSLAARLRAFPAVDVRALRATVERDHSVERWADAVLEAARR